MDLILEFFAGVGTTVIVACIVAALSGDEPATKTAVQPDTYHADRAADAIRRLGASGAIGREDADRIAREHVERSRRC